MGPWTPRQGGSFGGSFLSGWACWAWVSAVALSFLPATGGEASLWDIPINSSTQGPILEQLQLQHKVSSSRLTWQRLAEAGAASLLLTSLSPQFQERREVELRVKREEEERKRREEKRRQQQQQEEQKRRQEEEELFRRKQVQVLPVSWA